MPTTRLLAGCSKLVVATAINIFGGRRRALIPGTFHVWPTGYGALAERFCDLLAGNCEFFAKFAQLWQYRQGAWRLTIVFSYDHHAGSPAGDHRDSRRHNGAMASHPR